MVNVCKNTFLNELELKIEARTPIFSFQIWIYTIKVP